MMRFKDIHKGEIAVLIGNGPSLRNVPIQFLKNHITFGSNRVYLFYEPTYYAVIDELVVKNNFNDIQALKCTKFVPEGKLNGYHLRSLDKTGFSYDITQGVWEGFTISYILLQLAYYMGFQTVLCVGLDHQYVYNGKRKEKQLFVGSDPNHFSPDYFKGQEWYVPSLGKMRDAYILAKEAYEKDGRQIINLTSQTNLDVFIKGDIRDWM